MVFWGKLPANPRESPRAPGENGKLALHFRAGDEDFVRVRLGSVSSREVVIRRVGSGVQGCNAVTHSGSMNCRVSVNGLLLVMRF